MTEIVIYNMAPYFRFCAEVSIDEVNRKELTLSR